jgi:hypothetical protein
VRNANQSHRRHAWRRLKSVSILPILVLSLAAAGCGDSSDTKANEAYANGVCSAIADWEQQIKSIATGFTSSISKASLQSAIAQAGSATTELSTQIKAVPPPDTSDGKAAQQQLNQLLSDVKSTVGAATTAAAQIPADASVASIAAVITVLTPQVQNLASEAKAAASSLKDAGGSLASAFKSTDSCQNLGTS